MNDDQSQTRAPEKRPWRTPRVILSEAADSGKFSNTLESPSTAFGGGGVLTNQGPS